jgi:rare lipoprotein A (peptidoglycan hydrolase)
MIDLSKAAARQLDFLRAGICKVELTILPDSIPQTAPSQPDSTSYKTGATES